MKRLLTLVLFLCLLGSAHAFDLPLLGLFCPGNCSYSGSWTYNDPNGILTSTVTATATGNLAGNSGDISGSLFTQWGGTCFYALNGDTGCTGIIYPFPPQANGGCSPHEGDVFHFCYQGPGTVCQETFSGGWNAQAQTHTGAYVQINMQSDLGVQQVSGCPSGRPDVLTLDVASVPMQDCDGAPSSSGSAIPPFYCNENFTVVQPSNESGNPITGTLNLNGPDPE